MNRRFSNTFLGGWLSVVVVVVVAAGCGSGTGSSADAAMSGTGGGGPGGAGGGSGGSAGGAGGGGSGGGAGMDGGTTPADGGADVRATGDATATDTRADAASDGGTADVPTSNCPARATTPLGPHAAISAGYTGNLTDYSALYNVTCTTLQDCANACVGFGGTLDSCTTGSECIDGSSGSAKHCLPPTYWRYGDQALEESADTIGAAEQTLVLIAYNDPLAITDFRIAVPAGATIRGIQFDVRRSADDPRAFDDSIRVLRDGHPVGTEHRNGDAWPANLAYVTYGGPTDTWGETWAPSDFQTPGFGIAVAARYNVDNSNARAYVDYVRATVTYSPATCN